MQKILVITRHAALVQYLILGGHVPADVEVVEHADAALVTGRRVWGVLPHHLSALTKTFTEIPLALPPELRGKELSLIDIERYASAPVTYVVRKLRSTPVSRKACIEELRKYLTTCEGDQPRIDGGKVTVDALVAALSSEQRTEFTGSVYFDDPEVIVASLDFEADNGTLMFETLYIYDDTAYVMELIRDLYHSEHTED